MSGSASSGSGVTGESPASDRAHDHEAAVADPALGESAVDTRSWPWLALFLAVSLALYANALQNDFVFDDLVTVKQSEALRSGSGVARIFTDPARSYRPVRTLSFALDFALSGDQPWAYHLMNAVYHAVAAWLLFLVLRRLCGRGRGALLGALWFVCHPVHTESVAYISGRRDVLTGLFYLLAFWAFLRTKEGGRRWWAFVAVAFALGLGVKEMVATLPGAIFLHDLLLDRGALRRRVWIYGAGALCSVGLVLWITLGPRHLGAPYHGGSALVTYLTVARLLVHYLGLLAWPQHLLADYSFDAFPLSTGITEPRTLAAVAVLIGLAALALGLWRRAPRVTFGLGWIVCTLTPVMHLIPYHELAAEHYLYLPSAGAALLVAIGAERAWAWAAESRTRRFVASVAVVLALAALSVRTVIRNRDWKDERTLWTTTLAQAPRSVRANLNVGNLHAQRGDFDRAIPRLERAVELDPDHVFARMSLAQIHRIEGRTDEATAQLEEALRRNRALAKKSLPDSVLLVALGRYAEALPLIEANLAAHPDKAANREEHALCLERLGRLEEALAAYRHYLELRPRDRRAVQRAGRIALALGRRREADAFAERVRELLGDRKGATDAP